MKKSKIKIIESTKPFTNEHGITIYHNLEMDNGDKINIGKKKDQMVGWELIYQIVDEGQEYNKAKAVSKDDYNKANPGEQSKQSTSQQNNSGYSKPAVDVGDSILYQVSLKEATSIISFDGWGGKESIKEKCTYLTDIALQIAILSKENIQKLSK